MTEHAEDLLLKRLQGLSTDVETQKEILNQSIMNGWQNVCELKTKKNNTSYDMSEFQARADKLPVYRKPI